MPVNITLKVLECLCAHACVYVCLSVCPHVFVCLKTRHVPSYLKTNQTLFSVFYLYFFPCVHSSYNGISSLPPLELWRFPSLKALFLQGQLVLETLTKISTYLVAGYKFHPFYFTQAMN